MEITVNAKKKKAIWFILVFCLLGYWDSAFRVIFFLPHGCSIP